MNLKRKLNKYIKHYLKKEEKKQRNSLLNNKNFFYDTDDFYESREENFSHAVMFKAKNINDYIEENIDNTTFQTKLFKYIDDKNLKDSDVYNKVNIDRRLFSKIRGNKTYHPSKETIILLGIALELDEEEIEDLLESASYSLPKNTKYDLIIRFCFKEKIYDINQINEFLYDHECKTLN